MNEKVIIVECNSSCVNYLEDARKCFFDPIVLENYVVPSKRKIERIRHDIYYRLFNVPFPKTIMAKKTFASTLKIIKKINPIAIIPGGDKGIELAMKLSNKLGLYCNNISCLPSMIFKNKCQEKLKNCGVRYIKSKIIHSQKEAINYFKSAKEKVVVLKPSGDAAGASIGVSICRNEQQIINAFKEAKKHYNKANILLQEYIDGVEYTVNTYSSNYHHFLSSITKYHKINLNGHAPIYDYEEFLSSKDKNYEKLFRYAIKVLDALKIRCGPCHLEIKIDKKGPVLIEANCRLVGGLMKSSYLNKVLGFKESEVAFRSYFPSFKNYINNTGKLSSHGIIKYIVNKNNCYVVKNNLNNYFGKLKSFDYLLSKGENTMYYQTIDLSTHGGIVFLANKSIKQLNKDLDYVKDMEKNHYNKLFTIKEI